MYWVMHPNERAVLGDLATKSKDSFPLLVEPINSVERIIKGRGKRINTGYVEIFAKLGI